MIGIPRSAAARQARLLAVLGSEAANTDAATVVEPEVLAVLPEQQRGEEAENSAPAKTALAEDRSLAELADNKPPPLSPQEKMVLGIKQVASRFDAFRDQNGGFYIKHGGDVVPIGSTFYTDIVRLAALEMSGRSINRESLDQVATILRQAARMQPPRDLGLRIGKDSDAYLIDLGDPGRHCVKVTAQSISTIPCDDTQTIFVRGKGYGELPVPVMPDESQGKDAAAREAISAVKPLLLGVANKDWFPLLAAMVERLRCDSPHPILVAIGPPGSGKTTVAARWMMAVDPYIGDPPSVLPETRAVYSSAQTRHSLLIDNAGKLEAEMENLLCTTAIGSQITVPELYTTAESRTLALRVAWTITGVTTPIRQDDTHSRSLVIRVNASGVGKCRPESDMRAEFGVKHPRVLGALLWFLRERMRYVLNNGPQTSSDRMVDWEVTGEAITQSLGTTPGAYSQFRARSHATRARDWVEGDTYFAAPLVSALFVLAKGAQSVTALPADQVVYLSKSWAGEINGRVFVAATAEGLRDELRRSALVGLPPMPDTARSVGGGLDRVQGALSKAGWYVLRKETHGGDKAYWIFGLPL